MLMTTTPAAAGDAATDATQLATSTTGVSEPGVGEPGVGEPGVGELSLTKFLDPVPVPPVIIVPPDQDLWQLRITMRMECVRLHSQLPLTTVWTYNGSFPGPTISVRRGQKLRVNWHNEITGKFPVVAVEVQSASPFQTPGPGRDGVGPREEVAVLPPWTVVHLHGARTGGGNDGWTDNAVLPGNSQLAEYPNDQSATMLWYHDHAMAITALNVMSGLMGMYLIRDAEEDALGLPDGQHEVPLIVSDRNLDIDADGNLTGKLLHKVNILQQPTPEQPTLEKIILPFLGPFTLVNGVIWPYLEVDARWVRFRVLNASNSRFYQFELRDEADGPISGAMCQIGTDGGLLPAPVALDQLTLAPAERADILINFGAFQGKRLRLVNTLTPPFEPGTTTPNLDVMQFRVRATPVHDPFALPSKLSPSFVRLTHTTLPKHGHRWLVLTLLDNKHPEMWEMVEIDHLHPHASLPVDGTAVDGIIQVRLAGAVEPITLQRVGRTFKDAANFYIAQESWEQWRILNVSPVSHPIHLHLIQFQALSRELFDVTGFDAKKGGTTTPVAFTSEGTLDPNEQGWKDTIRVNSSRVVDGVLVGEMVSIIGQFGGASGRFMYHCHILEHEDEGMMSTFVVMPQEVMAIDPHTGSGHHPTPRQTMLWDDQSRFVSPRSDAAPPDQPQ
jgi:FtsP/CotA-like multicopper oxidase with cupredoxin domain